MNRGLQLVLLALVSMISAGPVRSQAPLVHKLERHGLKLEMAPLAPDQVRGFFVGRGFAAKDAEHLAATGCVFRSAIGSARLKADEPDVSVALPAWRVTPRSGAVAAPKTRERWDADWKSRSVDAEAATAFYWSLFPTEQTFAATDYNWGFLTFGLAAGTHFDLELVWHSGGQSYSARLEGLACAN